MSALLRQLKRVISRSAWTLAAVLIGAGTSCSRSSSLQWVNKPAELPGLEHFAFNSQVLGHEVGVSVYLPPGYSSNKRYPVLYYLHGSGGNESSDAKGLAPFFTDAVQKAGGISPIIVFPNGGPSRYWGNWQGMFFDELVPYIDKNYPTVQSQRILAGFSIGGHFAVRLSALRPDLFNGAISWAAGISKSSTEFFQLVQNKSAIMRETKYQALLINGSKDRPGGWGPLVELWQKNNIPVTVITVKDTDHNLGHYLARTQDDVVAFLKDRPVLFNFDNNKTAP